MTKMSATSQRPCFYRYLFASLRWALTSDTGIADEECKGRCANWSKALGFTAVGTVDRVEDHSTSDHLGLLALEIRKTAIGEVELELWIPQEGVAKVRH